MCCFVLDVAAIRLTVVLSLNNSSMKFCSISSTCGGCIHKWKNELYIKERFALPVTIGKIVEGCSERRMKNVLLRVIDL